MVLFFCIYKKPIVKSAQASYDLELQDALWQQFDFVNPLKWQFWCIFV